MWPSFWHLWQRFILWLPQKERPERLDEVVDDVAENARRGAELWSRVDFLRASAYDKYGGRGGLTLHTEAGGPSARRSAEYGSTVVSRPELVTCPRKGATLRKNAA